MTTGIYLLSFENTDQVYIGQSLNIELRFATHVSNLKHNRATSKLQNAFDTYGAPTLHILETSNSEESLHQLEQLYISEFDSMNNGFNSSKGGEAGACMPGELNPKALHNNEMYLKVLDNLVNTKLSSTEIAKLCNTTPRVVMHISAGDGHKWLQNADPVNYKKLVNSKTFRHLNTVNAKRKYSYIIDPKGTKYELGTLTLAKFCELHNLTPSKVSEVLNGKKESTKGWHC